MIKVRPSKERGQADHGWLQAKHSFSFANYFDREHMGFRALRVMNEDRIQGGAGFPEHGHQDMEIVTYPIEGELAHRDSTGGVATLKRGDVQTMSAGGGIRHSEYNADPNRELHLLQIWIEPEAVGSTPRHAEAHFDDESKRGRLQAIASPDGRDGSLSIGRDATVYSSLLAPGQSIEHSPGEGRHQWLQVIRGDLRVNGVNAGAGDGVAISDEKSVQVDAVSDAEFLLLDLD